MAGLYADLDVRRNPARRVDVRSVVIVYDFGPQPPPMVAVPDQYDAKRMRKYEIERAAWVKETGGSPWAVALNSIEATEFTARDPKRWRSSPAAKDDAMEKQVGPEPQGITGTLVNWNTSGVMQACWLIYDLISNQTFVVPTVDAVEWLARDARYSRAFL